MRLGNKIFVILFFFTSIFPFVSFRLLSFDVQPYCFVIATALLFYFFPKLNINLLWLALPLAGFFFSLLISGLEDPLILARAFIIYCTPFIVSNAVFFLLKESSKFRVDLLSRLVKLSVLLNFFIGLIQFFASPFIFDFIVEVRTSEERGVTGLTPEPSMFGLNLILLGVLLSILNIEKKQKMIYLAMVFVQVVVFSQSALAIVTLSLIFGFYILIYYPKAILLVFPALIFLVNVSGSLLGDTDGVRFLKILNTFIEDPSQILYADGSVSERFYHIILPLLGYGIPQGFFSFYDQIIQAKSIYPSFWWGDPTNKIMSGFSSAFWELGFFSIPFLVVPFRLAVAFFGVKRGALTGISIGIVYLNSVNYGVPIYSLMCGYLAYVIYRQRHITSEMVFNDR